MAKLETVLKRFEQRDEMRTFEKEKFEIVRLGGMTIGRANYQPGWKWSIHVGLRVGAARCPVDHGVCCFLGARLLRQKTATFTSYGQEQSSIFHPGRPDTTAGSSAASPTLSHHFLGGDSDAKE